MVSDTLILVQNSSEREFNHSIDKLNWAHKFKNSSEQDIQILQVLQATIKKNQARKYKQAWQNS